MDPQTRAILSAILNVDGFRAWLQSNPIDALQSIGISLATANIPNPISLPSDEEIRAIFVLDPNWDHVEACMTVRHAIGWQTV